MWMRPDLYFISGAAIPCFLCRTGFILILLCVELVYTEKVS